MFMLIGRVARVGLSSALVTCLVLRFTRPRTCAQESWESECTIGNKGRWTWRFSMSRWSVTAACAAASLWMLVSSFVHADIVMSTFEEANLASQLNSDAAFEGLSGAASQFRSGSVTFANDGVFFGGSSWSGFGYSRRTTVGSGQQFYNNSNDLISQPGTGAGGSATWSVVGGNGLMTADSGFYFNTVDIANTLYTWNSIANGDPFSGPAMGNGGGTGRFTGQDDFFTVRFTNTANSAFLDFNLADYRGNADSVVNSWQSYNLLSLQATQLSISFLGSRETNYNDPADPPVYFLDTPAYAAMDNVSVVSITAVPEPSSCVLMLAGVCALSRSILRRQKRGEV